MYKVGQGFVDAISQFPIPTNKKDFWEWQDFIAGFVQISHQLLVHLPICYNRKWNFSWTKDCDESFKKIKCVLMNTPVLSAPNFDKQFKLTVDASDIGIGEALLQESDDGVDRVVSYFFKETDKKSKKLLYY